MTVTLTVSVLSQVTARLTELTDCECFCKQFWAAYNKVEYIYSHMVAIKTTVFKCVKGNARQC